MSEEYSFDYDWDEIVGEYLEQYDGNEDNIAEFIDSLISIYNNDIWEVAQKLNLGHVSIRQNYIHQEMTV